MSDENDSTDLAPADTVERWLGEVFDGLTGTGAAGRRALIEIEDHLRAAVSDELGRGLDPAAAERAAVTRFGSPAKIARDIRAAHRSLLRPALTGIWALTGATLLSLGLAITVTEALTALSQGSLRDCPHAAPTAQCFSYDNVIPVGIAGLVLLGLGVLVLTTLSLTRRHTPMRATRWQPRRGALVTAEVLFTLAGIAVLGNPYNTFGVVRSLHLPWHLQNTFQWLAQTTFGVAVTVVAVAAAVWLGRLRQRPAPLHG